MGNVEGWTGLDLLLIALLDRHITDIEENRADMERRFLITELEADMYNSITVEEEEVVQVPYEALEVLNV